MTDPKPVWMVRAGSNGEDEGVALEKGVAVVSFRGAEDLRTYPNPEAIEAALNAAEPGQKPLRAKVRANQLWMFSRLMKEGDVIALPLKTFPGEIVFGRIQGPYDYAVTGGELRHMRRVEWGNRMPRSVLKKDLLYSLGALTTICRIQRNDASKRIGEVMAGKGDPGYQEAVEGVQAVDGSQPPAEPDAETDLAEAAGDEIVEFIRSRFKSHDLARLVAELLRAEGYVTQVSAPGPDSGADILAGKGLLGLDSPTLCVQVKSTEAPVDVKVLRELVGTMDTFKAEQGLLVSWGGFTKPLIQEARQRVFKVALWNQADIVNAVYRTYGRLSPDIQAEIPLKQVWMLVRETEDAE